MAAVNPLNDDLKTKFNEQLKLAEGGIFKKGNPDAQYYVGLFYYEGKGIEKDLTKAAKWYQKAAEQGHATAQLNLGKIMHDKGGHGCSESNAKAVEWHQKAALQGNAEAQLNLGLMYAEGIRVGESYAKAIEWFQKAAEQGNAKAQLNLGGMYYKGMGVIKSDAKAFEWWQKAAGQGNATAQNNLGFMYENGKAVAKSDEKAIEWYQKAADQGNTEAQKALGEGRLKEFIERQKEYNKKLALAQLGDATAQYSLGEMFYQGKGVVQSYAKAIECYMKAAHQGNADAQYALGVAYENGKGVVKHEVKANEWFQKAAESYQKSAMQGNSDSSRSLGAIYKEGKGVAKHDAKANEWFQKAADSYQKSAMQGNVDASRRLGEMHYVGHGVVQNYIKAFEWHQKAANQGNADSQFDLGSMYYDGKGVVQSYAKANEWWLKAANQGNALAQVFLGLLYDYGMGVKENKAKAAEWYQRAADQGESTAQYSLGNMYKNGEGVAKNDAKAVEWYQKAADQGQVSAQNSLGGVYKEGKGVIKSDAKAAEWWQKAAEQGYADAQYNLALMYEEGRGVDKSEVKALELYQKAMVQGDEKAQEKAKILSEKLTILVKANSVLLGMKKPSSPNAQMANSEPLNRQRVGGLDEQQSPFSISYTIDYSELKLGKELGKGGFGVVHQGIWRHNDVAIKQLLVNNLSAEATEEFKTEASVMARLRSPNIIQFYGCTVSPHYCIVMEYMPKGSLFSVLHSNQELTWSNRIRIAVDMAKGLAFLHQEHILHRDIKSLNVLLGESLNAKLTDFGLSKVKTETQSTSTKAAVGTLAWMAPELFKRKATYTPEADIYSLGITLWELTSRKIPFADAGNQALVQNWIMQGEREDIPADCPVKIASLIKACWEGEPEKRPTADEVASYLHSDKSDFSQFLPSFRSQKALLSSGYQGNLHSSPASGSDYQDHLNSPLPQRGAGVGK